MHSIQTVEIDVTTIHDIDGAWVGDEHIERVNIVQFTRKHGQSLVCCPSGLRSKVYLHAHLALKEAALAKLKPYERGKPTRFRPNNDRLLAFLEGL